MAIATNPVGFRRQPRRSLIEICRRNAVDHSDRLSGARGILLGLPLSLGIWLSIFAFAKLV